MRIFLNTVAVLALLPLAAAAHHSSAIYSEDEIAMKGTLVEVTWRNPHVLMHWETVGPDGKTVRWIGELPSVSTVQSEGLSRNSVKPGHQLIFIVRPARAGTAESVVGAILRADGTVVLGWSPQGGGQDENVSRQRALARVKLLQPFGITVHQ